MLSWDQFELALATPPPLLGPVGSRWALVCELAAWCVWRWWPRLFRLFRLRLWLCRLASSWWWGMSWAMSSGIELGGPLLGAPGGVEAASAAAQMLGSQPMKLAIAAAAELACCCCCCWGTVASRPPGAGCCSEGAWPGELGRGCSWTAA